jgi:hypothetical protein
MGRNSNGNNPNKPHIDMCQNNKLWISDLAVSGETNTVKGTSVVNIAFSWTWYDTINEQKDTYTTASISFEFVNRADDTCNPGMIDRNNIIAHMVGVGSGKSKPCR